MVCSFDTAKSLKNFGNAVSCGAPIEVGFRAMGHSNQGLQLCYLSILQKSNFVYLEFSKYFSVTIEMLHGSLGSWFHLIIIHARVAISVYLEARKNIGKGFDDDWIMVASMYPISGQNDL